MKLISWNVNGIRACVQKGFLEFFGKQMQIFSVCRRQSCRQVRLSWIWKGMSSTGIDASEKGIFRTACIYKKGNH